jgi:exopolyphosphatase / guanosine-5'-triphosphate,3'-diphosphate pyrophosphatase
LSSRLESPSIASPSSAKLPGRSASTHRRSARSDSALVYACIDIGSNTTRLLVADALNGRLRELMTQRAFTRIGTSIDRGGAIPREKIAETAAVVATQARLAREIGAEQIVTVATAAIRNAPNQAELRTAVEAECGTPLEILTGSEEARLSFVGATRTLATPGEGTIAVVDVGGGSTELAVGEPDGEVSWSESFRVGSGFLADAYLRSDPPSVDELESVRRHAAGVFEGLEPPPADTAVAVGGTATSLRRLIGAELAHETLERGIRVLSATPISEVASRFELDPVRVRLLPAGILVLEQVSDCLGLPLRIARGGLREGVILELLDRRAA